MAGIATLRSTVLDCPDPHALADFYKGVVGGEITYADDEWVSISTGGPGRISFQRVPDHRPPTWPEGAPPQQLHIDFTVTDMDTAEKAVLELGAVKHGYQPSDDDGFRVFLDPAGHPFCLCVDDDTDD